MKTTTAPVIHFPTEAEQKALVRASLDRMRSVHQERAAAVDPALAALDRLVEVCAGKSGQSFHIRALLYSLWNGQPTSLLNIVNLDWELRKHLLAVMLAFGQDQFFYKQVKAAFEARDLFDWFTEAYIESK